MSMLSVVVVTVIKMIHIVTLHMLLVPDRNTTADIIQECADDAEIYNG